MTDLHPDQTPQEYEAPAIVLLGLMDELTHGATGDSGTSVVRTVTLGDS